MITNITNEELVVCKRQISWTAIGVGTLVCLGLSFLLNLFSIATSLSFVTTDKTGMMTLAIGGFIGMAIGVAAVMFVSGFVAGKLGKPYNPTRNLGVVYGFATWSLALILTILLTGKIGTYVAFYSKYVADPKVVVNTDNRYSQRSMVEMRGNSMNVDLANPTNNQKIVDSNTQEVANNLGMSSLLVFVLFFIGAFFSAIGGHCGMTCCCKHDKVACDRYGNPTRVA